MEVIICIKVDLALNNLQRLICYKTQQTKPSFLFVLVFVTALFREFANDPGDPVSILGLVIPKTQEKWYLMPPCLTHKHYKVRIKGKWRGPEKGVAPSPTL